LGGGRGGRDGAARRAPVPRMNVRVSFLPDRERLQLVVRDIQASRRAFPLVDIASKFLLREDSHLLKLELPEAAAGEAKKTFWQCRECKRVFCQKENAEAHVLGAHLDLHFDREEVETEPPAGAFTCVAKCGFSGELLGPPNYHGYNEKIQDLWSSRFAHVSKQDYLARIEIVHDEGLLEQWKESMKKKTVYRLKGEKKAEPEPKASEGDAGAEGAEAAATEGTVEAAAEAAAPEAAKPDTPAMSRKEAQAWMRENVLGRMLRESGKCMVPGVQGRSWDDPRLRSAVDAARFREKKFPFTMTLALRPAFRHMGLHLFKLKGNETYVSPIAPKALETGADELDQSMAKRAGEGEFTRKTLLEDMRPGVAYDSAEATEFLTHLERMVAGGALVELHTGVLAVPRAAAVPAEGGKPEEKAEISEEGADAAATTEAPEVPEAPEIPETPEATDTAKAPATVETVEASIAEALEPAAGGAVAEAPAEEKAEDAAAPAAEGAVVPEEPKAVEARLEAAPPEAEEGAGEAPELPAAEEGKSGESGEGGEA